MVCAAPKSVTYGGQQVVDYQPGVTLPVSYSVADCFGRQLFELDSSIPFFLTAPAGDNCLIGTGNPVSVVSSPVAGAVTFNLRMHVSASGFCTLAMTSAVPGLQLPGTVSFR